MTRHSGASSTCGHACVRRAATACPARAINGAGLTSRGCGRLGLLRTVVAGMILALVAMGSPVATLAQPTNIAPLAGEGADASSALSVRPLPRVVTRSFAQTEAQTATLTAPLPAWGGIGLRAVRHEGGAIADVAADPARRVAWVAIGPRVQALRTTYRGFAQLGRTGVLPGLVTAVEVSGDDVLAIDDASPHGLWWIDGRAPEVGMVAQPIDVGARARAVATHAREAVVVAGEELVYLALHEGAPPTVRLRHRLAGIDRAPNSPVKEVELSERHVAFMYGTGRIVLLKREAGRASRLAPVRWADHSSVQALHLGQRELYKLHEDHVELWPLEYSSTHYNWNTRFGQHRDVVFDGPRAGVLTYGLGTAEASVATFVHGPAGRIDQLADARALPAPHPSRSRLSPYRVARIAGGYVAVVGAGRLHYVPDANLAAGDRAALRPWYALPGSVADIAAGATEFAVADHMHGVTIFDQAATGTRDRSASSRWEDAAAPRDLLRTVQLTWIADRLWRTTNKGAVVLDVGRDTRPSEVQRVLANEASSMASDDQHVFLCADYRMYIFDGAIARGGIEHSDFHTLCAGVLHARQGTRLWEWRPRSRLEATYMNGTQPVHHVRGNGPSIGAPAALLGWRDYLLAVAAPSGSSGGADRFLVLDVANAGNPRVVGQLDLGPSALGLRVGPAAPPPRIIVRGTEAAIVHPRIGFVLIDISMPSQPDEIGRITPPGTVSAAAPTDDGWLVGTVLGGLTWVERGSPPRSAAPARSGRIGPPVAAPPAKGRSIVLPWLSRKVGGVAESSTNGLDESRGR